MGKKAHNPENLKIGERVILIEVGYSYHYGKVGTIKHKSDNDTLRFMTDDGHLSCGYYPWRYRRLLISAQDHKFVYGEVSIKKTIERSKQ